MALNGWRLEVRKVDGESKRLGEHCGIYVSKVVAVISFVALALLHIDINKRLDLFIPVPNPINLSKIPPILLLTSTISQFTLVHH